LKEQKKDAGVTPRLQKLLAVAFPQAESTSVVTAARVWRIKKKLKNRCIMRAI